MSRIAAVAASVLVVLAFGLAGVGTVVGAPTDSMAEGGDVLAAEDNTTVTNATNDSDGGSIGPGARLAGVIGVQEAEIRGEVESRTFGLTIAASRSNGSKARIVANETDRIRKRLQTLENRTRQLNESYHNGSMAEGAYHARLARVNAQIRILEQRTNQTKEQARTLPEQSLARHGVNEAAFEQLHNQARNMTGESVSEIARQIGGPHVGQPIGKERGPPESTPGHGPPDSPPGQDGPSGADTDENETTSEHGPPGQANKSNPGHGNGDHGNGGPPDDRGNSDSSDETNVTTDDVLNTTETVDSTDNETEVIEDNETVDSTDNETEVTEDNETVETTDDETSESIGMLPAFLRTFVAW